MSDKPAAPEARALRASQTGARWTRWEMSSFEERPEGRSAPPPARAETIAAQIKRAQDEIREQARSEGYDAGHEQGRQAGFDEGAQAGRRQGYQEGHDAGRSAGYAEGREKALTELERLSCLAASCAQAIGNLEDEMEQALVSLGVRIAEHVLHSTLDAHPEKITDIVRQVLRASEQAGPAPLTLRVHPADRDLVRQYLDTEPNAEHWRLHADAEIAPGGCIAETPLGCIDATLATRWRRALAAMGCPDPDREGSPDHDS